MLFFVATNSRRQLITKLSRSCPSGHFSSEDFFLEDVLSCGSNSFFKHCLETLNFCSHNSKAKPQSPGSFRNHHVGSGSDHHPQIKEPNESLHSPTPEVSPLKEKSEFTKAENLQKEAYLDLYADIKLDNPFLDEIFPVTQISDIIRLPPISKGFSEQEPQRLENLSSWTSLYQDREIKIEKMAQISNTSLLLKKFYGALEKGNRMNAIMVYKELRVSPEITALSSGNYRQLIKLIVQNAPDDFSNYESLFTVLTDLKARGFYVLLADYNAMFHFISTSSAKKITKYQVVQAVRFFNEMKLSDNIKPDNITFNILIDMAIKAHDRVLANELLDEMRNVYRLEPSLKIITSLLHQYALKKDFKNLLETFKRMLKLGFVPDMITWNVIIQAFIKIDRLNCAIKLYYFLLNRAELANQIQDGNPTTFYQTKSNREKFRTRDCEISQKHKHKISLNDEESKFEEFVLLFEKNIGPEIDPNLIWPTYVTFLNLISGSLRKKRLGTAIYLFHEMERLNVKPKIEIYNRFFNHVITRLIEHREKKYCEDLPHHYQNCRDASLEYRLEKFFENVYNLLKRDTRVSPNLETFHSVAEIYILFQKCEYAKIIIDSMITNKIHVNPRLIALYKNNQ
ncbi:hypothetical protein G9A89_014831 [Geosiphon pyriformis]|nr:hypothetical protein G9A89_014831 [Geosiphon pyriformis]